MTNPKFQKKFFTVFDAEFPADSNDIYNYMFIPTKNGQKWPKTVKKSEKLNFTPEDHRGPAILFRNIVELTNLKIFEKKIFEKKEPHVDIRSF